MLALAVSMDCAKHAAILIFGDQTSFIEGHGHHGGVFGNIGKHFIGNGGSLLPTLVEIIHNLEHD